MLFRDQICKNLLRAICFLFFAFNGNLAFGEIKTWHFDIDQHQAFSLGFHFNEETREMAISCDFHIEHERVKHPQTEMAYDSLCNSARLTLSHGAEKESLRSSFHRDTSPIAYRFNVPSTLRAEVSFFASDQFKLSFTIEIDGTVIQGPSPTLLSSSDLRRLGIEGGLYFSQLNHFYSRFPTAEHFERAYIERYAPLVDLHTHYAAAISSTTILQVAMENGRHYPCTHFNKMKEMKPKLTTECTGTQIDLNTLAPDQLKIFENLLNIPKAVSITFQSLEDIYFFRTPLIKSAELFGHYLNALAQDYQQQGVQYAELSLSDIVYRDWIKKAHEVLPEIEARTGVRLRFLAAFWRHNVEAYNDEFLNKVRTLIDDPFLAGIDIVGAETNSTKHIQRIIVRAKNELQSLRPSFAIRVHAGENPSHPENAEVALALGSSRIGHGLTVTAKALELATKQAVCSHDQIVCFNCSSNVALSNAFLRGQFPIELWHSTGIGMTLGTDGHSLYGTNMREEVMSAWKIINGDESIFAEIRRTGIRYLDKMQKDFDSLKFRLDIPIDIRIPTAEELHINFDWTRHGENQKKLKTEWTSSLGISEELNSHTLGELALYDGFPLYIAGEALEEEAVRQISLLLKTVASNGGKILIVHRGGRGIHSGEFDRYIQSEAEKYGFPTLAVIPELLTQTHVVKGTYNLVEVPHSFKVQNQLFSWIKDKKGTSLFASAIDQMKDQMQVLHSLNQRFWVIDWTNEFARSVLSRVFPNSMITKDRSLVGSFRLIYPHLFSETYKTFTKAKDFFTELVHLDTENATRIFNDKPLLWDSYFESNELRLDQVDQLILRYQEDTQNRWKSGDISDLRTEAVIHENGRVEIQRSTLDLLRLPEHYGTFYTHFKGTSELIGFVIYDKTNIKEPSIIAIYTFAEFSRDFSFMKYALQKFNEHFKLNGRVSFTQTEWNQNMLQHYLNYSHSSALEPVIK